MVFTSLNLLVVLIFFSLKIFIGWYNWLKITEKGQTVSDRPRSDHGHDNNKTLQLVMFIHGKKESVPNNVKDTFVTLIDDMKGGDA